MVLGSKIEAGWGGPAYRGDDEGGGAAYVSPLAPPKPAALMFVCKGSGRNLPL